MSTQPKFEVIFHSDVVKEYQKLDPTVARVVDKALEELEHRADEVGKTLGNLNDTKLAGCKEIKLRDIGIRIVFRITNESVQILRVVYVLAIERRSRDLAFKLADKRLAPIRKVSRELLLPALRSGTGWRTVRRRGKKKE